MRGVCILVFCLVFSGAVAEVCTQSHNVIARPMAKLTRRISISDSFAQ